MIINLIATPRNVSTAIMYAFAQHSKVKVMDEPFYAYYLNKTGIEHPGRDEVLKELPVDLDDVFDLIGQTSKSQPYTFIKNMAHHLSDVSTKELSNFTNIFLTRHPKKLIASFSKVITNPTMQDIGVKTQWERFKESMDSGQRPLIIDSDTLLQDPEGLLLKWCTTLNLDFEKSMLQWKAGPIKEDGSWAKHWYASVHKSTGFSRPNNVEPILPDHCKDLYEEALKYYHKLSKYALTVH